MLSIRGCLRDWHVGAQASSSHEPLLSELDAQLGGPFGMAWGLMAEGHGFTSHGGITLSRGLALPKVEASGHPRHPPPLGVAVVNNSKIKIYFSTNETRLSSGVRFDINNRDICTTTSNFQQTLLHGILLLIKRVSISARY